LILHCEYIFDGDRNSKERFLGVRHSSVQQGIGSIRLGKHICRIVADKGMDLPIYARNPVQAGLGDFSGGDFVAAEFSGELRDSELVEHLGAGGVVVRGWITPRFLGLQTGRQPVWEHSVERFDGPRRVGQYQGG